MPFELRDFTPALRFLMQDSETNAMMIEAVRQGPRPGFAVIVDDPNRVRAVLLVGRPDWRKSGDFTMTLQLEAENPEVAAKLLAWLPHGPRYRILTYRPWLSELIQPLVRTDGVVEEPGRMTDGVGGLPVPRTAGKDKRAPVLVAGLGNEVHCREWALEGTILEGTIL